MTRLKKLDNLLSDMDYEADAVSMTADMVNKISNEFQQEYEKNVVTLFDLENHFGCKILIHSENSKEEFQLYSILKERD